MGEAAMAAWVRCLCGCVNPAWMLVCMGCGKSTRSSSESSGDGTEP